VQAPWSGQFLLNVTFNGKWGVAELICRQRGAPQTVAFPQTDEQGQQLRIPVTLSRSNQIDFAASPATGAICSLNRSKWSLSSTFRLRQTGAAFFEGEVMQQYQFPQGFLWGAAASGPQTEGVTNKRHRSIWDSWFAEQPEILSAGRAANRL
jgi:hypothetical protein